MDPPKDERKVVIRRWTDEIANLNTSSALSMQDVLHRTATVETEDETKLKSLYEDPDNAIAQDFELADVAREELQKLIVQFDKEPKPSGWQQLGSSRATSKVKAQNFLRESAREDVNIDALKASIEDLEVEWKEKHGSVYSAFKKICNTLDDHRSILKVFPSQNDYASPIIGSVTILMKAAKSHSEVSLLLSRSVADISDKVASCSNILAIIKTSRARRKLAEIYARLYQFYQSALEWYLKSRFGRLLQSFNENLLKSIEDTKSNLEDSINELYREAAVANTAMVALVNGKFGRLEAELNRQRQNYELRDFLAGKRMEKMVQATWSEVKQLENMIEIATLNQRKEPDHVQDFSRDKSPTTSPPITDLDLKAFVIGNEISDTLDTAKFCVAEIETLIRLRSWMADGTGSRTLWISSPYEPGGGIPGSRAAVMTAVVAAWQAEAPIISYLCKRPSFDQLRAGMSIEQVGLISLVYSLICQLWQFNRVDDDRKIYESDLHALDGTALAWDTSLSVLKALLDNTPVVTFCVIDGLNDFELGKGKIWCEQLISVLKQRQQQPGISFNILFSTAGQSRLLPIHIKIEERYMATKRAKEVRKLGTPVIL